LAAKLGVGNLEIMLDKEAVSILKSAGWYDCGFARVISQIAQRAGEPVREDGARPWPASSGVLKNPRGMSF